LRRDRHRGTQDVNAEASFSVEEEGKEEGYYFGLIAGILKYMMSVLCGLLLVATQTLPDQIPFVFMITIFYVVGWILTREAGFETLSSYGTVVDAVLYGLLVGFLLRVVEGLTLQATTGIGDLDVLSPWEPFMNASTNVSTGLSFALAGLIFAAVGEEMLHRGGMIYLADLLDARRGLDDWTAKGLALVITSASFAVLHSAVYHQLSQITALFAGGIILGLSLYWKKDITVPIIAHLTINLTPLAPYFMQYLQQNPFAVIGLVLVGGFILLLYKFGSGEDEGKRSAKK
jgi:membrane protease YdiL (CAAX protease family)